MTQQTPPSTSRSRVDAALITAWLGQAADDLHAACPLLTELDAARGDADHGVNMDRGFRAIADELSFNPAASGGEALTRAAAVLRKTMGGTTGPLWSIALRRIGKSLGTSDPVDALALADGLMSAADGVSEIGEAREGDNTMLDALYPAIRALRDHLHAGDDLVSSLAAASDAAAGGAEATASRVAKKGRASYLGERAIGHADPGATSAAIVVAALLTASSR